MCTIVQDALRVRVPCPEVSRIFERAMAFARQLDETVGHLIVGAGSWYHPGGNWLPNASITFMDGSTWHVEFYDCGIDYWRAPWMPFFQAYVYSHHRSTFIRAPDDYARLACCAYNGPLPT